MAIASKGCKPAKFSITFPIKLEDVYTKTINNK